MPGTIHLLLIDDDEDDFIILRDLLRDIDHTHYQIEWLSSAREARPALAAGRFDVALVDVRLGPDNGLELIREARRAGVHRPIILLTGYANRDIEEQAIDAGIVDFLVKGRLDAERLGRAIRYAIEHTAQLEALELSEQRYRALFEDSPAPLMVCELDTYEVVAANSVAHRLFGYTVGSLPRRRLMELIERHEWPRLKEMRAAAAGGVIPRSVWQCRRRDGSELHLEIDSQPIGFANRRALILHLRDVSDTVLAQRALREKDLQFRHLIDHAAEALVVVGDDQTIRHLNPRAELLLGGRIEQLIGSRLVIENTGNADGSGALRRSDGERRMVDLHRSPTRWGNDAAQVITLRDVTELRRVAAELEYARNHDPITRLPRFERLERELDQRLAVLDPEPTAMLFVNLDRFYSVNEAFGHAVGDRILQEIGARLAALVGERGSVARVAGDEFLLVLPGARLDHAWKMAETVVASVSEPIERDGFRTLVTASVGIALCPDHGSNVATLIRCAEAAMTQAKRNGRDGVALFAPEQGQEIEDRLLLGSRLREAIRDGEMVLHYQPQIDATTRRLVGFEGLVRWKSPQFGLLSPGRFVPIVESMGLMMELGSFVIHEACLQLRSWMDAGASDFTISINVSAQQLARPGLVATVSEALRKYRVPARMLELEMTESTVMEHVERVNAILDALKQVGVKLALDDFGTGYSSLAYLKQFALDKLKIDRSFVRDLPDDANDAAIARTIIAMGHQLKMRVSAEGIETERQRDFLLAIGCDELQGYLYGPGEPASTAARWLFGETSRTAEAR